MAMSGRGRGGRGGGGNDRRAAPTQRIASGARTAPYARPGGPSRQASSGSLAAGAAATASEGQPWPPNQISIKGASGPTWIVVSNLVLGVSDADIRETFQQFGAIESVKSRKSPSDNHPSQAFEIAFTHLESAKMAIEKLNGALADGRVLQVFVRDAPKRVVPPPADAPAAAPRAVPAAVRQRDLFEPTADASGSKAAPSRAKVTTATARRELLGGANGKARNNGSHAAGAAASPGPALQSRILSAQELQALSRQQGKIKHVHGASPNQASAGSLALAKRIGSLPLAQRLAADAKNAGPASSRSGGGGGGAKKGGGPGAQGTGAGNTKTTAAKRKAGARSSSTKGKKSASGSMDVD